MSQENVEIVRRLYEAQGGPELGAVTEEILDAEIEWHASEVFGVLRGRTAVVRQFEDWSDAFGDWRVVADELIDAGDEVVASRMLRYFKQFIDVFEDFGAEPQRITDAGEHVLAFVRYRGRGKESAIPVDMPFYDVLTFRDTKVVKWRAYMEESQALKAVGLAG